MNRRLTAGLTVFALLLCYASTLAGMIGQWWTDEDMGHAFVVPFVIAWIVWRERARWQSIPSRPALWGLPILASGAVFQLAGALGVGLFAASVGLVLSAAGAVVLLAGFPRLRAWAFPFLLSLFMLPKLAILYNQATLPLQLLASRLAAAMLTAGGFAAIRDGNILNIRGHRILVAEACSGIRYLLPLAFVATLLVYLRQIRMWARFLLLAAAIPVAIVANALRVALAGASPVLLDGTHHARTGIAIFLLSIATLILLLESLPLRKAEPYA